MCENTSLIPKPFVFEDMIAPELTKVYLPGREPIAVTIDGIPAGKHMYPCVHLCEQFANYPVINWGIRCIPSNAQCKFGGKCVGSIVLDNGKSTKKTIDLNHATISGLQKPQKTR